MRKGRYFKSMYIQFTTGLRNICTMSQERGKKLQTCPKLNNNFTKEFSFYMKVWILLLENIKSDKEKLSML